MEQSKPLKKSGKFFKIQELTLQSLLLILAVVALHQHTILLLKSMQEFQIMLFMMAPGLNM